MNTETSESPAAEKQLNAIKALLPVIIECAPSEAVKTLEPYPDEFAVQMLGLLNPGLAQDVLAGFSSERRQRILAAASPEARRQWMRNETYGENTVGHMMEGSGPITAPAAPLPQTTALVSEPKPVQ